MNYDKPFRVSKIELQWQCSAVSTHLKQSWSSGGCFASAWQLEILHILLESIANWIKESFVDDGIDIQTWVLEIYANSIKTSALLKDCKT
jgi:hypothetical protein